jgi:putative thioredoxin
VSESPNVVEITDENFMESVVEESKRRPVVVDFWAEWCAPCRMIGPVLERLADEHGGAFVLGKLDVDANPQASMVFGIQSIPAVKAFVDGKIANEFVGALPETAIRQFLESLVPSAADQLAAQGFDALADDRVDDAAELFRQALSEDAGHAGAALGLAQVAAARGDAAEARRLLEPLRPEPEAERVLAALDVSAWASEEGANGQDPLGEAERAAAEGRFADALAGFLERVRAGDEDVDRAREGMLKLFAVLGDTDPLVLEYRPKLASALF